ncbi:MULTISPECIES: ParB N-terminal domain-containing protein [Giesbergeria]|uniref:ParB/Sulfiredoxin domain-containing protein n=1 Tax=Giesbergeria sinuosa TaxID=80883 RepID=A0ABV9QCK9_9BURK
MTQFQKPEQSGQAAALPKTYAQHPLSAAFPAMTAEEFQELKDSIENFGPMSPVVIANGMVLHGWDIYRACTELAVPYQVQELPAHVTPQDYLDAQSIGRKASSVEQVSGPNAIMLALESIRIDGNTQSRVELDQAVVAEYAEAMAEGAQFPPLIVFFDGAHRWLGDGFHRYFGARKAGLVQMVAEVRSGTQQDAQLFSFGVNASHGLRRTNADKRKAVTGALQHPVSCQWSDRQIAKHCGVSGKTVASVRQANCGNSAVTHQERTYTTKHGTTAVMNTSNIGKKPEGPQAAPLEQQAQPLRHTVSVVPPPKSSQPDELANLEEGDYTPPEGMTEEDFGPSPEEIAEALAHEAAEKAKRELLEKMIESDNQMATLFEEAKMLKAQVARLERYRDELMNKAHAIEQIAKKRDRENLRLRKELDALRGKGGAQ